eukprot:s225_g14.t1
MPSQNAIVRFIASIKHSSSMPFVPIFSSQEKPTDRVPVMIPEAMCGFVPAVESQEGKQNEGEIQTQARIKEELIQTLKNIRFEKGRIEDAIKHRKVVVDAITQGEDARAEVRRQLRRGMMKTMHFLAEEEQEVGRAVGMPQLLPSTWQGQMQREWVAEVKPAAELYAQVLFASRLAGSEEETARTGRSSENVERLKDLVNNAEAFDAASL